MTSANVEKTPEILLTRQIAKKLFLEHGKRAKGQQTAWLNTSTEERKLWWGLAKSAVHLMKKQGFAQP